MANARSPNYPAIGLQSAIDRLAIVYEKEHTHKAPSDVMARALGYQGLNGKSLTLLSALKKFGLLDEIGKELKVSNDGLIILAEPASSLERAEAIRRAAFAPTLFEELRKTYGETVPSDENLRAFLLRKGFIQSAVDAPIRAYRETIALVNSLPKAENAGIRDLEEDSALEYQAQHQQKAVEEKKTAATMSNAVMPNGKQVGSAIPVGPNSSMTILADGEVTQEGLQRLMDYIKLIKDWFPETAKATGD